MAYIPYVTPFDAPFETWCAASAWAIVDDVIKEIWKPPQCPIFGRGGSSGPIEFERFAVCWQM
jgi:hypothetical protein